MNAIAQVNRTMNLLKKANDIEGLTPNQKLVGTVLVGLKCMTDEDRQKFFNLSDDEFLGKLKLIVQAMVNK